MTLPNCADCDTPLNDDNARLRHATYVCARCLNLWLDNKHSAWLEDSVDQRARTFDDDILKESERSPTLGPAYFDAHRVMARYRAHFQEEHLESLVETIGKAVQDKVWDDFRNWLLDDTEANLASDIQALAERMVRQWVTGEHSVALDDILLSHGFESGRAREAIIARMGESILKTRIEELERSLALNSQILNRRTP